MPISEQEIRKLSQRLLIAIPVYNHSKQLSQCLGEICDLGLTVLVVDDGSEPSVEHTAIFRGPPGPSLPFGLALLTYQRRTLGRVSPQVPRSGGPVKMAENTQRANLHWLRHERNLGKGAALKTAFSWAEARGFQQVLSVDGDGQHVIEAVRLLILSSQACDPDCLILGVRDFTGAASQNIPNSSRFGRSFSNFWIWCETGKKLQDTQTGLRVWPIASAPSLRSRNHHLEPRNEQLSSADGLPPSESFFESRSLRYDFEIEALVRFLWKGGQVIEVEVPVHYPKGRERVSHFRVWKDNLRLTRMHTQLCTLRLVREFKKAGETFFLKRAMGFPVRFSYLILVFPVLWSFLFKEKERSAIVEVHRALGSGLWRSRWRAFQNFWYFGASIVDRMRLMSRSPSVSSDSFLKCDLSALESGFSEVPSGSILVGSHFGDWLMLGQKFSQVMKGPVGVVFDPSQTPQFASFLTQTYQGRPGTFRVLDSRQDSLSFGLSVKEILDEGGCVCFLCDRVHSGTSAFSSLFLGKPARFVQDPFLLAVRLNAPVCYFSSVKSGPGPRDGYLPFGKVLWKPESSTLLGTSREAKQSLSELLVQRYTETLEAQVKRNPNQWFNFFPFWEQGANRD